MASNKGITLEVKNNKGSYTPLYPLTTESQVLGWNIGKVYGPYNFELNVDKWVGGEQSFELNGLSENDIVYCVKVLKGTSEQSFAQAIAYKELKAAGGIISSNNRITFICTKKPKTSITVQVWWTR